MPLRWAAISGHEDVAKLPLTNNGGVNARDGRSSTPLHWAEVVGREDMADLLRQHGGHE
jgi:ankyrin repeat protein